MPIYPTHDRVKLERYGFRLYLRLALQQNPCSEREEKSSAITWATPCTLALTRIYFAETVFASRCRAEGNLYVFLEVVIKKECSYLV
jgi:hypothetical protein